MNNSNVQSNWPRIHPAEVVAPITILVDAGAQFQAGKGTVKIFRPKKTTTPDDYTLSDIPSTTDPDIVPVYRNDFGPEILIGTRGFVVEDAWGVLWWLNQDTNLIRFTLTEELNGDSESTATATINSDGTEDGQEITVTNWATGPAKIGAKGIAWLSVKIEAGNPVKTYYVVEIDSPGIVRFTLTSDLLDESTASATINSAGEDNGDPIEVTRWSVATEGKIGDRGIAWKQGETYYVIELAQTTQLIRFTLTSDLLDESIASATINSAGEDNGDPIEVTRWSVATEGKIGDRGIAWKQGDTYYIIELAQTTQLIRFTLLSRLMDESEADASINSAGEDNGDLIIVRRWSQSTQGEIGTRGIAWKQGETYYIIELSNSDNSIIFQATTTPAYGVFNAIQTFEAIILNADNAALIGEPVTVKTIGRTRVKAGMRGAATLIGLEYIATELQQPASELIGTLSSDLLPSSTTATGVTVNSGTTQFPADVLPTDTTITAQNLLRLRGFDDSKVLLRYDAANDNYFIAQVYGYADRIVGSVSGDFESSSATVTLSSVSGLNGVLSPAISEGTVSVNNTHEWNGSSGGRARAEYNWTEEQWELYQIDCSEEQGSPPGSGPGADPGGGGIT